MMIFSTSDRLKQIMSERNLRQVDILNAAKPFCEKYNEKLTKSMLSEYVSGASSPGQFKLGILGEALGVSPTWLMGYDVPMEPPEPLTEEAEQRLSKGTNLFRRLPAEKQDVLITLMQSLLEK